MAYTDINPDVVYEVSQDVHKTSAQLAKDFYDFQAEVFNKIEESWYNENAVKVMPDAVTTVSKLKDGVSESLQSLGFALARAAQTWAEANGASGYPTVGHAEIGTNFHCDVKDNKNGFRGMDVDVIQEVVRMYDERGKRFDNVCCLLATCPLVKPSYISEAYDKLIHTDFISVYPVVQFSYPILRSLKMDDNGEVSMNWPEYAKTRSQDLAPAYHDSGTFYWHKITPWLKGIRKGGGIVIDEDLVQDIDTEQDWRMAELKFQIHNTKL